MMGGLDMLCFCYTTMLHIRGPYPSEPFFRPFHPPLFYFISPFPLEQTY